MLSTSQSESQLQLRFYTLPSVVSDPLTRDLCDCRFMWDLWAAMWSDPVSLTSTEKNYSKLLFRNSFELRVLGFFPTALVNPLQCTSQKFNVGFNLPLSRFWPNWNMQLQFCERFEPWIHFISRLSMIVRVKVVLNRTVIVDSDWRFLQPVRSNWVKVTWWY